ncbi:cysteinyl-tRNA synthetase [Cryomyces antarcticus]|uniref:Cysteinyl-tRNA synthetase n=1 Tax=Cryomyces antarcticus TaxID=329879 RepID=A0ABR0LWC9_9PEZI|nr:cysteinyl-tRNA synthetase [Cryomyces antarcticus]
MLIPLSGFMTMMQNYVSTDIIRRVLQDYFKFKVTFVMNITDVDDKIILRGRQRHLFAEFVSKHDTLDDPSVISIGRSAWHAYVQKNLPLLPEDLKPQNYTSEADRVYGRFVPSSATSNDAEAKLRMHRKTAAVASKALVEAESQSIDIQSFYGQTQDVLLPYLDKLYGSSIDASDYSIFTRLTQEYEKRFMEDVRALNVLDPTIVTRVTEYSEEIVEYVKQITSNGFAYATSDGSVYFDIVNFEKSGFP